MPHENVMRIDEIINAEHLAQRLTRGGCLAVSGHEHCYSIMHNLARTSPPTFHLIFPTHSTFCAPAIFTLCCYLRLSKPLL